MFGKIGELAKAIDPEKIEAVITNVARLAQAMQADVAGIAARLETIENAIIILAERQRAGLEVQQRIEQRTPETIANE